MKRAQGQEFELPDDLVIGTASGDEDGRSGAGSTLPQDLFPLGKPTIMQEGGPAATANTAPSYESTRPLADADNSASAAEAGDTLPPDLAPDTGGVSAPTEPAPAIAIVAPPRVKGRLPHDGPQPKKVLVVDDDLTMRLYMRSRLMLRGHVQLMEAASGEEALKIVQTQRFDAVLLDVDMGSKNGFETCRALRNHVRLEGGKQPRIYMITSRSGVIDKMRAKMAGADAFLSKPPHPGELAELLTQL
jgi:CheY-like chemotaxis protein